MCHVVTFVPTVSFGNASSFNSRFYNLLSFTIALMVPCRHLCSYCIVSVSGTLPLFFVTNVSPHIIATLFCYCGLHFSPFFGRLSAFCYVFLFMTKCRFYTPCTTTTCTVHIFSNNTKSILTVDTSCIRD